MNVGGVSEGSTWDPIDQLIVHAAEGVHRLTSAEIRQVLDHVAQAGFNPHATETARSGVAGIVWQGRVLRAKDKIRPDHRHFLKHVVVGQQWPVGTSLQEYVASIAEIVLDPTAGAFTSQYLGVWSLGVARESREVLGPNGNNWVLVEYRLGWGHWVTAFQPKDGLDELMKAEWSDVRWLRRPTSSGP